MTEELDPFDVLMAFMCDEGQPVEVRLKAAIALMPYFHTPLSPVKPEEDDE